MRTIIINGVDYSKHLIDGFVITETLSEELDNANIILTGVKKTNFNPFEKVIINENGNNLYYVIDTYVESKISNNPQLYEYNINVISETKVLERIILPNLKITKPREYSRIKKLGNYLDFLVVHYTQSLYYLELDSHLKAELNKYDAPEWAWATPTLKQVFNDMLQTLDNPKLVKVNDGIIGAVELSVKGNKLNNQFGKVTEDNYQASKDYVNHLVLDTKNIIPAEVNAETAHNIGMRSIDKAYLTDNDMQLYIQNARIDKIDKVILTINTNFENPVGGNINFDGYKKGTIDIDITDAVIEETEYNKLFVEDRLNYIYYERGGNSIKGWMYNVKIFGLIDQSAFFKILENHGKNIKWNNFKVNADFRGWEQSLRDIKITIWFHNIGENRVRVYRDEKKAKDFALTDNQTSSFINFISFMQAEKEKINRLGNEIRTITAIYKTFDNIPKLSDYVDDYILAKRTISCSKNGYIFKGTFSKNYIQKNIYYGLKSRTRYNNFEMANNSVIRNENIVQNILFTTTNAKPDGTSKKQLCNYIARNYTGVETLSTGVKQIIGTSTFQDKTTTSYFLQPSIYSYDYGVIVSCRFYDNVNVGLELDTEYTILGTKYNQKFVTYVDNNGELTSLKLQLFSQYNEKYLKAPLSSNFEYYEETRTYPNYFENYVNDNYIVTTINDGVYKDNGEILQYDLQYNFKSDGDVILGLKIGSYNPFADFTAEIDDYYTRASKSKLTNLKIYISLTETYNKGDIMAKGEIAEDYKIDDTIYTKWQSGILDNNITIVNKNNNTFDTTSWKSWCLATENGELIFGVNRNTKTNEISTSIYITLDN